MATLEQRHQLMNTEATVDNNFELFEAQRIEEIKVTIVKKTNTCAGPINTDACLPRIQGVPSCERVAPNDCTNIPVRAS